MLTAALPDGLRATSQPELRQHFGAISSRPSHRAATEMLRALGIFISKRQVVRLLIEGQEPFLNEANECCAPTSSA
jgi:hypothetical protein